jgi:radical SAM superfamily enzyme YgiQ (UPF0313 family)
MSKIVIGLVQINNSFSNHNYLPYSVGLLQAYVEKYLHTDSAVEFLLPLYKRIHVASAVEQLTPAHIVFFSTYVWNMGLSLEIAKHLKQINPQVIIVFGGPQVPSRKIEEFLTASPYVDIAAMGEGEAIALSILENFDARAWDRVHGIGFLDEKGTIVQTPPVERISNLDMIPSPYLSGVFDPLIKQYHQEEWIALWETNRGCPFTCADCDWGASARSKVLAFNLERLYKEIDWFSSNRIEFVFCCDANFGILPRDIDFVKYFAANKEENGFPKALSVQNTKNSSDRTYAIEKIMADAGLSKGVALALQSLNGETLAHIRRANISISHFQELQKKFSSDNIETFTDLILGLPCETYETFAEGTSAVIESGQHHRIQFNNLSILPNSAMGDEDYQKKYGFDIVKTRIINAHGSLLDKEEVEETQQLVVGTSTMTKEEWIRVRVLGWIASLLYFDKLLQIPFIILHQIFFIRFRTLLEAFTNVDDTYPTLYKIQQFFIEQAVDLQNGGSEFFESKEWLNLWWPADELVFIKLCTEDKLDRFYFEAEKLMYGLVGDKKIESADAVLHDAVTLNRMLLKKPFQKDNVAVTLGYNIWELYTSVLKSVSAPLKSGRYRHIIDRTSITWPSWEDWCREVVWYGNKKGAYLYHILQTPESMAG